MSIPPRYWPRNIPWNDSIKIKHILESLPPIFVLESGEQIRGVEYDDDDRFNPHKKKGDPRTLPKVTSKQTTKDLTYLATVQSKVPSKIKIVLDKLRNRSSGNNKPFQTRAYTPVPVGAGYQKNIPVNTYKPYNRRGRNTGAIQTVQTPANQSSSATSSSLLAKAGYYALPLGILAGAIYAYNSGGGAQVLTDFIKSTTTNGIQTSTGSTALYQAVITNEKLREQLTTPKDYSGIYKAVAGTLVGGALTLAGGALSGAGHALGNTMFNALFVETPIAPSDDTLRGTEGQTVNAPTVTSTTIPPTETPIAPSDDTLRGVEGQTENTTTVASTTNPPTETSIASSDDAPRGMEGQTENTATTLTTVEGTPLEGSRRGSYSSISTGDTGIMIVNRLPDPLDSPRSEMVVADYISSDLPEEVLDAIVPREI